VGRLIEIARDATDGPIEGIGGDFVPGSPGDDRSPTHLYGEDDTEVRCTNPSRS